jgi:CheY-like chemotaxis protein
MRKPVVLCVDDEVKGLIGREALLKQKGYDVLISTSPQEALKLLASCPVWRSLLVIALYWISGPEQLPPCPWPSQPRFAWSNS